MAADASPDPRLSHVFDLSTVVLDPERAFTERMLKALDLTSQWLDLPYGLLTHIDQQGGRQDIVLTVGTEGLLEEGESLPLSETYCRKTIATDSGALAVETACEEGWGDDPAYRRFGLESYVGSAVDLDGARRGTVCFAGEQPREKPLDDFELGVVDLLARWASYELAHRTGREAADPVGDRLVPFSDGVEPSSVDTAFDLLANRARRELLSYLATTDGPVTVDEAAAYLATAGGVPGRSADRVEIALVHSHVPKLASADIVAYDERTRELDYRPSDAVERVLRRVRPLEP